MKTLRWAAVFGLWCAVFVSGCDDPSPAADGGPSDSGSLDGGVDAADAGPGDRDAAVGGRLDDFEETVAAAQCAALFRCCDEASLVEFFAPYRPLDGFARPFDALAPRIPPEATLTEESCVGLMRDLNDIAPLGSWLAEARALRVGFDEAAYDACLESLATASCGLELAAVFSDTTCFAYQDRSVIDPTAPVPVARAFFERTRGVGETCVGLEDPGTDPWGSCDPTVAFCCFRASPDEGCGVGSVGASGDCAPIAGEGDECSAFPALLCGPGLRCRPGASIDDPSTCVVPASAPLGLGEACSAGFEPLGVCTDGFCDAAGTETCTARRADTEPCSIDDECASGHCGGSSADRVCAAFDFCVEAP